MDKLIIGLIVVIIIAVIYNYSKTQEKFTNDEAIQNIASLYNQANLNVTQITTPKIVGTPNVAVTGNISIPGTITSPSLDNINNTINTNVTNLTNQLNAITARIKSVEDSYVKRGSDINLLVTNSAVKCGTAATRNKVLVSDNWFLRAWPIAGQALDCGAQFSIE